MENLKIKDGLKLVAGGRMIRLDPKEYLGMEVLEVAHTEVKFLTKSDGSYVTDGEGNLVGTFLNGTWKDVYFVYDKGYKISFDKEHNWVTNLEEGVCFRFRDGSRLNIKFGHPDSIEFLPIESNALPLTKDERDRMKARAEHLEEEKALFKKYCQGLFWNKPTVEDPDLANRLLELENKYQELLEICEHRAEHELKQIYNREEQDNYVRQNQPHLVEVLGVLDLCAGYFHVSNDSNEIDEYSQSEDSLDIYTTTIDSKLYVRCSVVTPGNFSYEHTEAVMKGICSEVADEIKTDRARRVEGHPTIYYYDKTYGKLERGIKLKVLDALCGQEGV